MSRLGSPAARLPCMLMNVLPVRLPVPEDAPLDEFLAASAKRFAKARRTVIGLTGAQDFIRDGERLATIANGDPLMARVTAMGCVASALVGAALAVEPDAWKAMAAALIAVGVAGEVAAARSRGPGSFAMEILDAVYALDRGTLMAKARVS